ncbi:MAG: cytochrome c-type biogenesis CcmF C-terminal domain-containing protein, partial [Gammaproteobacteria bacterium]
GTFLVRSGVLTSVHAFANDPERGVFVLGFLAFVAGGSLLLFAWRAAVFDAEKTYSIFSREMFLLVNNVLLMGAMVVVLLGTLFPLISEMLGLGKISVGPPYFNTLFVPLSFLLMLAMGVGMVLRWKQHEAARLWRQLRTVAAISVLLGVVIPVVLLSEFSVGVIGAVLFSAWVVGVMALDVKHRVNPNRAGWWRGLRRLPRSYVSMLLAHFGLVVLVLGVAGTSYFSVEKDVRLRAGDTVELGPYSFEFVGVRDQEGPNYSAVVGDIRVRSRDAVRTVDTVLYQLNPEKRTYWASGSVMTEASIEPGFTRDLYVALGEPLGDGDWAVRVYYKPMIQWLWLSAIFMVAGGCLAVSDKRYRFARVSSERVATSTGSASVVSTQEGALT